MIKTCSRSRCAICKEPFDAIYQIASSDYDHLVCTQCDSEAVTKGGKKPKHGNEYLGRDSVIEKDGKQVVRMDPDVGDNPVFIDGNKCWRRYEVGGWVTQLDPFDCDSIDEFCDQISR